MKIFDGMKNNMDKMKFDFTYGNAMDKAKVVGKATGKAVITGIDVFTIGANIGDITRIAGTFNKLRKCRKGFKFVYTFTKNAQRTRIAKVGAKVAWAKHVKRNVGIVNAVMTGLEIYDQLTDLQLTEVEEYVELVKQHELKYNLPTNLHNKCKENNYHTWDLLKNNLIKAIQRKLNEDIVEWDDEMLEKIYNEFTQEKYMEELIWGIVYDDIAKLVNDNVEERKIHNYIEKDGYYEHCIHLLYDVDFIAEYLINDLIMTNVIEDEVEEIEDEDIKEDNEDNDIFRDLLKPVEELKVNYDHNAPNMYYGIDYMNILKHKLDK